MERTSGSGSTNSRNNFKSNKSRGRKELSMNATLTSLRMLNARCARKTTSEVQQISEITDLEET